MNSIPEFSSNIRKTFWLRNEPFLHVGLNRLVDSRVANSGLTDPSVKSLPIMSHLLSIFTETVRVDSKEFKLVAS